MASKTKSIAIFGRRRFIVASGALLLSACATRQGGTYEVAEVPAPSWRVGDRWTYRRTDYYTKLDAGTVTREVTALSPDGIRIATRTLDGRLLDDATYSSPGIETVGNLSEDSPIAGRLNPPFERYVFPLTSGKQWRQSMTRTDRNGFNNPLWANTRVEGWETVKVAGRDVRAIRVRREFNLGPKDPFTGNLHRTEIEWYAPDLRGPARIQVEEWFFENRNKVLQSMRPGARYLYELESFTAG
jgi:hypothetical protein